MVLFINLFLYHPRSECSLGLLFYPCLAFLCFIVSRNDFQSVQNFSFIDMVKELQNNVTQRRRTKTVISCFRSFVLRFDIFSACTFAWSCKHASWNCRLKSCTEFKLTFAGDEAPGYSVFEGFCIDQAKDFLPAEKSNRLKELIQITQKKHHKRIITKSSRL